MYSPTAIHTVFSFWWTEISYFFPQTSTVRVKLPPYIIPPAFPHTGRDSPHERRVSFGNF